MRAQDKCVIAMNYIDGMVQQKIEDVNQVTGNFSYGED
jgi:hypothetical protein